MNTSRSYGSGVTSSLSSPTPFLNQNTVFTPANNSLRGSSLVQSSSPSSPINRGISDLVGQGLAYLKNNSSSVARGVVGLGAPLVAGAVVSYAANKAADVVNSGIDYLLGKKESVSSSSASGYKPISDPFSSSDSTNGPVYSLNGNRIGSDGATADGGNVVTPPPTQKPYTPPLVSSASSASSSLIAVLSEQNAILRAGFASLSASSSLNSSTPYTPSSTSSVPSNVPASLKQALEKSGQSGSAQWSDDGNSLTIASNAVRSSGIARSVINGESVSSYDLPSDVKNAAQSFYSDLGLTTLSQYESGLKNVSYNRNDTISIENAIISSYLSGEISASDARERIANNRLSNTTPLTRIETYEVTDPKTGKVTTAQREVPLASNPGKNFTGSPAVSGSSVVGSPSAQAPVINIPAPVINVPPIEIAAPTVNVSVPAAPSTPVTVENKIDFTELTAAVRTIPDAMPKREKIEAVADLKKESLEYDKEAKTHIVSGYEVSASPREDRAAYHAQGAKLAYDKNDFKADDIDFGLDDMLSSIAHINYSGVYDSVMNAMDKIKIGEVNYTPSISSDFITYSYYVGV